MEEANSDPAVPKVGRSIAFDVFYRQEFPKMVALAVAVSGSRLLAEDVAQDAMVEASKRWDVIGLYDKPGAWVRRITIQKASKRLRRRRLETAVIRRLGPANEIPAGSAEVEEVFEAIKSLPARQRAAVALRYLDGYTVVEVAEILGCAEGTAKAHLFKARSALAQMLSEESI
jgi:RNA polymerase sigma-70 factor (ECF subfamily)